MICVNCKQEKEQNYTYMVVDNKFGLHEDCICKECNQMFEELELIDMVYDFE